MASSCTDCIDDVTPPNPCMVTGCSGQVCAAEPVATTCEWQPAYECLKFAECGLHADEGSCGWNWTPEWEACMEELKTTP